jgi:hypothetical protein
MAEISTFTKFKDWLTLAAIAATLSLLGVLRMGDVHRIDLLEVTVQDKSERLNNQAARIAAIEAIQNSQRDETFRRLDRIERKLDELVK